MRRQFTLFFVALGLASALVWHVSATDGERTRLFGIASGDVTSGSAVVWARANGRAHMQVEYDDDPAFSRPRHGGSARMTEETDFTATVLLEDLVPYTTYYYRVRLHGPHSGALAGTFRTSPDRSAVVPVSFIVGADVGGQGYCRRVDRGYAIFSFMRDLSPDFYIANGDGVYVDLECPAQGPVPGWENIPGDFVGLANPDVDWEDQLYVRSIILAHYRYNWDDPHFQAFQRSVPVYAQWDDHEVNNDFGLRWEYLNPSLIERRGFPVTAYEGLRAFFDYWPIRRNPAEPQRIYRSFSWGSDVDLFLLDERSYRSRNDLADTPESNKTMLGEEQLAWLKQGLANSTATWKIVANTVPLSMAPTSTACIINGRDSWANGTTPPQCSTTGFERELLDLMAFLDDHDVKNIVWLATDVHHARSIHYAFDANGDGDQLLFHEFVSGPLSALRAMGGMPLDTTLNPTPLYEDGGFFNFGYYRVAREADGESHFVADVRDEFGRVRPPDQSGRKSTVDLVPER